MFIIILGNYIDWGPALKSLRINALGEPGEVIALASLPFPTPTEGEVVVRLEAAPINPSDFMLVRGRYAVKPTFPFTLGAEGVGRVVALGPAVNPDWEGRRVIVLPTNEAGTWAEEMVAPVRNLVAVGESDESVQMSMLGINPLTAYLIFNHFKVLKAGDTIAQTAANSAVGHCVAQLAHQAGVQVVHIVRRPEAFGEVRRHKGDLIAIEGDGLIADLQQRLEGRKLSLVLDSVGGKTAGSLTALMDHGGAMVCYAAQSGTAPLVSPIDLNFKGLSIHGFWLINWIRSTPRDQIEALYQRLADLIRAGAIKCPVEAVYGIDDYEQAIAHALRPHRIGKVLFKF
jgi:NADPH:quinone reductase-like Zn-dependent oxidoreductase